MKTLVRLVIFLGLLALFAKPASLSFQHYQALQASNASYIAWRSQAAARAQTLAAQRAADRTHPPGATPANWSLPRPGR